MKREFVSIFLTGAAACLLPIAFGIASAQSAEAPGGPRFDVADVHPSPSSASGNQYMRGGFYRGGGYEVRTASMVDLSPAGRVGGGGGGRSGDGPAPAVWTADDPGGAISLQEAIEKQLGLKLEPRKNPGKVVVIDHVEQKPTEN